MSRDAFIPKASRIMMRLVSLVPDGWEPVNLEVPPRARGDVWIDILPRLTEPEVRHLSVHMRFCGLENSEWYARIELRERSTLSWRTGNTLSACEVEPGKWSVEAEEFILTFFCEVFRSLPNITASAAMVRATLDAIEKGRRA